MGSPRRTGPALKKDARTIATTQLARLETAIALDRMLARFPGLALDGDVTWNGRVNLRGPANLPVLAR